ncbi:hypothetical protein CR155_15495 [Pollutimonas nitritireducens]|uniref:Uncharacterized protein n=1 Tax=Pollutimonas nitritireducens TaxID=2045209 RepID=A0A2N4UCR6_9BURK|nr:hypothetical protein [Pollutimonas nitritireducens]PLC52815.1 hypothetical protein CR155_15495 [Pollutimonas nitritireducens]
MTKPDITSAETDRTKLALQGRVRSRKFIKIFHLYSHRFLPKLQLWGTFANLSEHDIYFSLDDARNAAETKRSHGANFRIEELPAVWVEGLTHAVVISELFSAKPCRSLVDANIHILQSSIGKVMNLREQLPTQKWMLWDLLSMGPRVSPSDRNYTIYRSHLTGASMPIQWSMKSLDVDDTFVARLAR